MNKAQHQRELTGRHMLLVMFGFFGVIIAVNVTMAVLASRSWTGLVVGNTYVASQEFNERTDRGRRQQALGWQATLAVEPTRLSYSLTDAKGELVPLERVEVLLHRPVSGHEDTDLILQPAADGAHAADISLEDGTWIVEVEADAGLEFPYRDVRRIQVRDGVMR